MAKKEGILSTWEMVAARGGRLPKGYVLTEDWRKPSGVEAIPRGGSVNIPACRMEAARLNRAPSGDQDWRRWLALNEEAFMASEDGSLIYRMVTFPAVVSAISSRDPIVSAGALRWCAQFLATMRLCELGGRIVWPGQRSAGHAPIPALTEWVYARALGGDVKRAEAWCRAAGAGLRNSWQYALLQVPEVAANLVRAGEVSRHVSDQEAALWPRRIPLRIIRYANGALLVHLVAVDGNACSNGNTPPIVAGIRRADGSERWFPDGGGPRIRQKMDFCAVRIEGGQIEYTSKLYGEDRAELPGQQVASELTLGA